MVKEISKGRTNIATNITTIVNRSHTILILSSVVKTLMNVHLGYFSSYSFFRYKTTLIFLERDPLLTFSFDLKFKT
jgi:hypothetical protein